jgi:hypothetical protein
MTAIIGSSTFISARGSTVRVAMKKDRLFLDEHRFGLRRASGQVTFAATIGRIVKFFLSLACRRPITEGGCAAKLVSRAVPQLR